MLTGELPLSAGTRVVGRATEIGMLGQRRQAYAGDGELLDTFVRETGLARVDARTLLAKFGLGVEHVQRACMTPLTWRADACAPGRAPGA